MTYPVDDLGNPRVDFVWGSLPIQPDQDRQGRNLNRLRVNQDQNTGWANSLTVGSDDLHSDWSIIPTPTGDGGNGRQQIFEWGYNDIATTGYSNYPAFIPNYAGDGDTDLEVTVPNLIGMVNLLAAGTLIDLGLVPGGIASWEGATVANNGKVFDQEFTAGTQVNLGTNVGYYIYEAPTVPSVVDFDSLSAATDYLENLGLVVGTVTTSTSGATSGNDGWIKSQSIAAGTIVDAGTAINLVTYDYVAPPSINYNIAGIRSVVGQPLQRYMYLHGRNSGLVLMDQITLHDTGIPNYERPFNVIDIADDDAFNTGGQRITITNGIMDGSPNDVTETGYYTKP